MEYILARTDGKELATMHLNLTKKIF